MCGQMAFACCMFVIANTFWKQTHSHNYIKCLIIYNKMFDYVILEITCFYYTQYMFELIQNKEHFWIYDYRKYMFILRPNGGHQLFVCYYPPNPCQPWLLGSSLQHNVTFTPSSSSSLIGSFSFPEKKHNPSQEHHCDTLTQKSLIFLPE